MVKVTLKEELSLIRVPLPDTDRLLAVTGFIVVVFKLCDS